MSNIVESAYVHSALSILVMMGVLAIKNPIYQAVLPTMIIFRKMTNKTSFGYTENLSWADYKKYTDCRSYIFV